MKSATKKNACKVLVIDVGGTHIKVLASGERIKREIVSGLSVTASRMVRDVKRLTADWKYDVVSMGYPGPVVHGRPLKEPYNLGGGWVGFHYGRAFGRPIKIVNDAAMQALGSYQGGRMLFLGLGTGLGSAMIAEGVLQPMELAHLPYKKGKTYEDYVGLRGLKRFGKKKWRRHVAEIVEELRDALEAEYVVLGGGDARLLKELPPGVRLGDNDNAFRGGFRLWATNRGASERLSAPAERGESNGVGLVEARAPAFAGRARGQSPRRRSSQTIAAASGS
ncbi:MAG: ROK family protein [Terriglobia bacterium]